MSEFDARATYGDAAADYELAMTEFWEFVATRTVDRLQLRAGERVLDAPCGTGPGLLTTAERVGPAGRVLGIDFAEPMIAIARDKVRRRGLDHVEVRAGDMTGIETDERFDAVVCALGIFFVDDMPGLVRSFLDLARPPGGRLGIGVFGERFFDPMREAFVEAVHEVAPEHEVAQPWRRVETEALLQGIFDDAEVAAVEIVTHDDRAPLRDPDGWWRIVMGSGLRSTVMTIGDPAAAEVRDRCDAFVRVHGVTELHTRTRYAVARL